MICQENPNATSYQILGHAFLDNLKLREISILLGEIHLPPSKLELSVDDTPIEAPRQLLCSDPKEEVQDFQRGR
jgi:hypothetical protein